MRIVQLIDSLDIGGAEKMAVNYANAISRKYGFSALVTTRKSGVLASDLDKEVVYLNLARKKTIDIPALLNFRRFCQVHQIRWVQAHGTSYFTAVLLKLILPSIQIIWHDHNGLDPKLRYNKWTKLGSIKLASFLFKGIVVVNEPLLKWAQSNLNCDQIKYLPNFIVHQKQKVQNVLSGEPGKRVICLANLRFQKDHFLLVDVAKRVVEKHPEWTFHCVGKDNMDAYSSEVKKRIVDYGLEKQVFLYGSRPDASALLEMVEIGILTSEFEGLPVALLEYGNAGLAVVATAIGQIPQVLKDGVTGYVVPPKDVAAFSNAVISLIENEDVRQRFGKHYQEAITNNYSENAVVEQYLQWLKKIPA